MTLTEIEYGSLASSEVINNNFQYLDDRISGISENLIATNATINSNIATINNSISSLGEETDESVEALSANINDIKTSLNSSGLYITTYINGTSWYREYFSDAEKTERVWLAQGGRAGANSTVALLKSYSNANYTLLVTPAQDKYNISFNAGYDSITSSSFHIRSERDFCWYTSGK